MNTLKSKVKELLEAINNNGMGIWDASLDNVYEGIVLNEEEIVTDVDEAPQKFTGIAHILDTLRKMTTEHTTEEKYARKCDVTGEGMNAGFCYRDGEKYFKYENDFAKFLRENGADKNNEFSDEYLINESYAIGSHYYTEWGEDQEDFEEEYYLADGTHIEVEQKGRIDVVETRVFKFKDLSDKSKQKAITNLYDINVSHDWWDMTYEDAAQLGFKIRGFDLGRGQTINLEIINSFYEIAQAIVKNWGECDDRKIAEEFLKKSEKTIGEDENDELEGEFQGQLHNIYFKMLKNEYEYLMSDEAIKETIEANDYEFTEEGKLYS